MSEKISTDVDAKDHVQTRLSNDSVWCQQFAHEVISLTTYEVKQLPKGERKVPVKVVEQRATNFLIHVLTLGRTEETKYGKESQKDHARQIQAVIAPKYPHCFYMFFRRWEWEGNCFFFFFQKLHETDEKLS